MQAIEAIKGQIAPPSTLVPSVGSAIDECFAMLLAQDHKPHYGDARSAGMALPTLLSGSKTPAILLPPQLHWPRQGVRVAAV